MWMVIKMASSAFLLPILLRRQFRRSGGVAYRSYCSCIGNSVDGGGVTSPEPQAPWLMMSPQGHHDGVFWRFFCFATSKIYSSMPEERMITKVPERDADVKLVGSSHGWIASYDHKRCLLFLIDPFTNRLIKLPPLTQTTPPVHNLILDHGHKNAFITFGSAHALAFCPLGGREWILLGGGGDDYDSLVYSNIHRRLFCITSTLKLEAWDVGGGDQPRLDNDWVTQLEIPPQPRPRPDLMKLNYIVCEEQSGEVFVVVRHVKPGVVERERGWQSEYVGSTVDFEVYKVDEELKLMRMVDCLGGVTMFVGNNHPIAIKDKDIRGGVKPDAIYFAYDNRVTPRDSCDYGIFDYQKRALLSRPKTAYYLSQHQGAVFVTPHG